jgi:hypothetical protein
VAETKKELIVGYLHWLKTESKFPKYLKENIEKYCKRKLNEVNGGIPPSTKVEGILPTIL